MVEVEIVFSRQADLILRNIPHIDRENFLKWFVKKGMIVGGGDIIDYLKSKEVKDGS